MYKPKADYTPEEWQHRMAMARANYRKNYQLDPSKKKASCARNRARHKAMIAAGKPTNWLCDSPEYNSWRSMIKRCTNPNTRFFKYWGGRGISVCKRWAESYQSFLEDMGKKPFKGAQIDRIDNGGNYEPSNCRWATRKQQLRNTRRNRLITYAGRTMCLSEWGEECGIGWATIQARLNRGWSVEDALKVIPSYANKSRKIGRS